jgi:transcriptional regulator with XRE-family HTH domain
MSRHLEPVLQSWLLRTRLRRERSNRGLTQKEAADLLEWSAAKILRIEGGLVNVSLTDLRALLSLYKITDADVVEYLEELARGARGESWAAGYESVLTPEFIRYVGYESGASAVKQVESQLVPGALQTPRYARSVITELSPIEDPPDIVERRVEARLKRQDFLFGGRRPAMSFIIDEAVIRRPVGGVEVMVEQLQHLKAKSAEPDVNIQVLPFALGVTKGMRGPFVLLEFGDPDIHPLLFIETSRIDLLMLDDDVEIGQQSAIFFDLEHRATPPEQFEEIIDEAIDQMTHQPVPR